MSTTMVYLLNLHPILVSFFKTNIYNIYESNSNIVFFVFELIAYCIFFFISSIFYDKLRLFSWIYLKKLF